MPPKIQQEALTDEQVDIVNANLGLVRKIANESRERRLDYDDRFQAGCVGLIRAVQKWDPAKGALSTYSAWWIRAAIRRAALKAPPLASLDATDDDEGIDPAAPPVASDLDPIEAARLRDVVVSLPDEARAAVVGRFWRGEPARKGSRAAEYEAAAINLLRKATRDGREIPPSPPWWSDPSTGEVVRPSRLSEADERVMRPVRLLPRFPITSFTPGSPCPHKGPIPRGTLDYCPCCDKSGQDGVTLPVGVAPLPKDRKPAPKPAPKPGPNRKERRAVDRPNRARA